MLCKEKIFKSEAKFSRNFTRVMISWLWTTRQTKTQYLPASRAMKVFRRQHGAIDGDSNKEEPRNCLLPTTTDNQVLLLLLINKRESSVPIWFSNYA